MITNEEAKDCAALAAFNLGLKKELVYKLQQEMKTIFDLYTKDEIEAQLKRHFQKNS